MTRKDYVLLAEAFFDSLPVCVRDYANGRYVHNKIAQYVADALALDNDRFDRERFLEACGVQS